MSERSELKRLAEACPWEKIEGFEYAAAAGKAYCLGDGPHNHLLTTFDRRFQKYIEAANPAAVLSLIADYDSQAQECDSVTGKFRTALLDKAQIEAERDAALKQVEGLLELMAEAVPALQHISDTAQDLKSFTLAERFRVALQAKP